MIIRRIAAILFVPLMLAFGSGVYLYLGTLKSKVLKEKAQLPTVTKPKFELPGTMFVVQDGRLFRFSAGSFTEIGPAGDWSQPALTPDHTKFVAVLRAGLSSDLYLLDTDGNVIRRLTRDDSRIIEANHWAFYPHVTPDGAAVTYSFDSPKLVSGAPGVDFSIWTMPLNGSQSQARRRTDPYWYTGGDVSPVPLAETSLVYVKHTIDPATGSHSQIWFQSRPGAVGRPLTNEADNCSQPSISPDATQLLMICSQSKLSTRVELAPFNGQSLGPARVLLDNGLYAQPTWSPDGKGLVYYAPGDPAGHFELWWLSIPPPPAPSPSASPAAGVSVTPLAFPTPLPTPPVPVQVTQGVDLTATSPPAWY